MVGEVDYKLTGKERALGAVFDWVNRSSLGALTKRSERAPEEPRRGVSLTKTFASRGVSWFLHSGLWEMVFRARVSNDLLNWVKAFAPEVLYVNPTSIYMMELALRLSRIAGLPICLQIEDDAPATLYKRSPAAFLLRPWYKAFFLRLVRRSCVHIANNNDMAVEYRRRYGVTWVPIFNADCFERFNSAAPATLTPENQCHIVYCGSLYLERWRSIADVARAAQNVVQDGRRIVVDVFTSRVPPEAVRCFARLTNLNLHDMPPDEDVPSLFKAASVLLLAESFAPQVAEYIRLSISAKAHLYMMSQRPILVYGPSDAGSIRYAREWGWGAVVDRVGDGESLSTAIRRVLVDKAFVAAQLGAARKCAFANHRLDEMQRRFTQQLCAARNQTPGIPLGEMDPGIRTRG